jgi:hypothetical protein
MASWTKDYKPDKVASRMEKVISIEKDGTVTFKGSAFEEQEHVVLLNSMLSFHKELPETEKNRIIYSATLQVRKKGKITPDALLNEINEREQSYLAKKPERFTLISGISISRFITLPTLSYDGAHITFETYLNKKYKIRNKMLEDARYSLSNDLPDDYMSVKVSVTGRSADEAAGKALDKLDFIRGIWNLQINRRRRIRISSGLRKPVNEIILAPIHTLHKLNGKMATGNWWYEPHYQGPVHVYDEKGNIANLYKFQGHVRRLMHVCRYKDAVEKGVIRYVRALDARDWDDSFLRLWGVLEYLTNTGSDSYKVTIRRAAFLFSDREYAYQVLSHLKDRRNKSVHAGSGSDDIEILLYQLKRHVEVLIQFHLGNKYSFTSLSDAAEFMDLPSDLHLLEQSVKKLGYAMKFISGKKK